MQTPTIAMLAASVVGATLTSSSSTHAQDRVTIGPFYIESQAGRCLEANISDPPGMERGRVRMWDCNGTLQQQWLSIVKTTAQGERFQNVYSGTCLDRPGDGSVYLWPCHDGPQQAWWSYGLGGPPGFVAIGPVADPSSLLAWTRIDVERIRNGMPLAMTPRTDPPMARQAWYLKVVR